MNPAAFLADQLGYVVDMAKRPGWYQHARLRAREIDADFPGFLQAVVDRLKADQFRPLANERIEWHK